MVNKVVVGVGNIYANESLFLPAIQPTRPAHTLSLADCYRMVSAVKTILTRAIEVWLAAPCATLPTPSASPATFSKVTPCMAAPVHRVRSVAA